MDNIKTQVAREYIAISMMVMVGQDKEHYEKENMLP